MNQQNAGYLVIARRAEIPSYRGLYARAPFLLEKLEDAGFEDPYLSEAWTDDMGLIRTYEGARVVLAMFGQLEPEGQPEIIYVRTWSQHVPRIQVHNRLGFLGYDVADDAADFYSILADNAIGETAVLDRFAPLVNENGLFDRAEDAQDYRDVYQTENLLIDPEEPLVVWEVYAAPSEPP